MKRRTFLLAVAAATASTYALPSWAQMPDTFSVSIHENYLPLSHYDQDQGWHGFAVDLTRRLLEIAAPEAELAFTDGIGWTRVLRLMETGRLDFLYEVSYRKERTAFMDYIGTTDVERAFLITRADQEVGDLSDLNQFADLGIPIMINRSVSWNAQFDARLENDEEFSRIFVSQDGLTQFERSDSEMDQTSRYEAAVARNLVAGRIGGTIASHFNYHQIIDMTKNFAEESGIDSPGFKATRIVAFGEPVTYLAMTRLADPHVREAIREAYRVARDDGSFQEIWARWYGSKSVPPDLPIE